MKKIICLCFLLINLLVSEEKLSYDTFYLGFHAQEKERVIRDFLSEEGKLYPLGQGSIFVRDRPEVLEEIKTFIKNQAGIQAQSLIIKLRGKGHATQDDLSLKGRISTNPLTGEITLGQLQSNTNSDSELSVSTLSGHVAKLSDIRNSEELQVYRSRYMNFYNKETFKDGFEFEVLPILSGKSVKVVVKRSYYATIEGKRRSFQESTLSTTKILPLGRWSELSGTSDASSTSTSSITGLSTSKNSATQSMNFELRVDLMEINYDAKN